MLVLDNYYLLLQAFHELGRRMYGNEWTGTEYDEPPLETPEAIAQRRTPLEQQVKQYDARQTEIEEAIRRTTDANRIGELRGELDRVIHDRTAVRAELMHMYTPDDAYRTQYRAYERRQRTEAELFGALEAGAIEAQYGHGTMIHWQSWSRTPGFKVYIDLSMVVAPRRVAGLRRAPALLRRDRFDEWLKTIIPEVPGERAKMPPEDRCRAWLRDHVVSSSGVKRLSKQKLREDAMRDIPDLKARAFDRIWLAVVPAHWRDAGAPKRRKN